MRKVRNVMFTLLGPDAEEVQINFSIAYYCHLSTVHGGGGTVSISVLNKKLTAFIRKTSSAIGHHLYCALTYTASTILEKKTFRKNAKVYKIIPVLCDEKMDLNMMCYEAEGT